MSEHYEKHANEVAQAFLGLLNEDARSLISEEHQNELAMLVEAAISTAVFEQLEHAADEIAGLSGKLRSYAEHYDRSND
jgi:hypothetical protein